MHATPPRKVLHVMNNASGGAAMSTVALIEAMRARGVDAAVVCHPAGSEEERQAVTDAARGDVLFTLLYYWNSKFRTPWHRRPINELKQGLRTGWSRWSANRVAAYAAAQGADLLHTSTILNPEGGLAARALGLPHVWHLRELVGPGRWFRLPVEREALGRHLEARCSTLVANSHTAAAAVRDGLPPGLLAVVPNGIDLSKFSAERAAESGPGLVAAMVSNLGSHFKKHALFVEAAARVDRSLPIEFRIYGADPSAGRALEAFPYVKDVRDRIARHGLEGRVTFRGFVPEPARIMREIDVLVHPSDLESFGRIAVEAMAASRPVVGVAGGGVGEIVEAGVTGLLAAPDDAAGLAAHVETLARDEAMRRRMGREGRRRAEALYSIDAHADRMFEVYREAMGRPLGRGRAPKAA